MKVKYLIIAFSISLVFVLSMMGLLPVLLPGSVVNFMHIILPLFVFMVLILISLGIFFLYNYRLFLLLEREDWPALAYYLEQKILVKEKYDARKVRILASTYMVMSDYHSVIKLENKAFLAKPSVVGKNILIFGAARVLSGKYGEAAAFFGSHLEKGKFKKKEKEWIRWYYGFSHLLNSAFINAEKELFPLTRSSRDALITGLSAYFLFNTLVNYSLFTEKCRSVAENGKERVVKTLKNAKGWKKEVNKMASEIHIAIIRKYIEEAGIWLFSPAAKTGAENEKN